MRLNPVLGYGSFVSPYGFLWSGLRAAPTGVVSVTGWRYLDSANTLVETEGANLYGLRYELTDKQLRAAHEFELRFGYDRRVEQDGYTFWVRPLYRMNHACLIDNFHRANDGWKEFIERGIVSPKTEAA